MKTVLVPKSPRWSENYARFEKCGDPDALPCVHCGLPIKLAAQTVFLHDVSGGAGLYLHPDSETAYQPDGADMGNYPIGAGCLRQNPQLKPFVTRKLK